VGSEEGFEIVAIGNRHGRLLRKRAGAVSEVSGATFADGAAKL
jgi:hypothetical protein